MGRIHDAPRQKRRFGPRARPVSTPSTWTYLRAARANAVAWQRSLEKAIALAPEHLSLYALTLEEGTPLARRIAGRAIAPEPDPDAQAEMYTWSSERLADAGYEQYEISNWAKPGHRCRHNLTYWQPSPTLGWAPARTLTSMTAVRERAARRAGTSSLSPQPGRTAVRRLRFRRWNPLRRPDAERQLSDAMILGCG